jgi:hypothetical protein
MASLSDIVDNPVSCGDPQRAIRRHHLIQRSFDGINVGGAIGLTMARPGTVQESREIRGIPKTLSRSGTETGRMVSCPR